MLAELGFIDVEASANLIEAVGQACHRLLVAERRPPRIPIAPWRTFAISLCVAAVVVVARWRCCARDTQLLRMLAALFWGQ